METGSGVSNPTATSRTAEELRLVAAVLRKDRKATAEFVVLCTDAIYPFVRRRLMPRIELVEDLMQEILFAAWRGLPNFRGEANLRSWMLGIARHKLDDYYRRRIRDAETLEEDDTSAEQRTEIMFDRDLDAAATKEQIQRTLALLPEAYALALIWRYREEKSLREMAALCGKTEKAMERLLARARENFRRRCDQDDFVLFEHGHQRLL
jgi:RNA polymerase sigma-70 factor, ECF subfamily